MTAADKARTFQAKSSEVARKWFLVDAGDWVLGRLAVAVATALRGHNKPEFSPHADTGDFVIVVNAANVRTTGKKRKQKIYYRHTGYIGNLKRITLEEQLQKDPRVVIEKAVRGMLPRGPLGRAMLKKLKIYPGPTHPHSSQQPEPLKALS